MPTPQHWMHRDRASKPLTLTAQLAAVTAERNALQHRLNEWLRHFGSYHSKPDKARERVDSRSQSLRNEITCQTKYIKGLKEERDALRAAAEGLAEALIAVKWIEYPDGLVGGHCAWCEWWKQAGGHALDCQGQQALAAWRAADGG